jgi:hypothetical protein
MSFRTQFEAGRGGGPPLLDYRLEEGMSDVRSRKILTFDVGSSATQTLEQKFRFLNAAGSHPVYNVGKKLGTIVILPDYKYGSAP